MARTFFHHPKKRLKRESLGSQIFYHPQEAQKKDWQEFPYHPQEEVMNHEKKSSRFFPLIHPQGKGYEYKYLALHSFLPNPQEVQVMNRKNTSNEFPLSSTRRGAASNNLAFLLPFALSGLFFFVCITCRLCAICFLVFTLSQHLSFCRCISLWKADLELLCRGFRCFFHVFFFSLRVFLLPSLSSLVFL